jgi:hypothetical protein
MAFERPVLIIFHGDTGDGPAERMMAVARVAAARNTATAARIGGFEAVIVATDDPAAFGAATDGLIIDADGAGEAFDYAARLRGIVGRYGLRKPAVMGSGAVPLVGVGEFKAIVEGLEGGDGRFVTNNFFSADITAWTPGSAIDGVAPFERDNVLPRRLRDAGLASVVLPRTKATQFDLDTPTDLVVLALTEGLPPALARAASAASPAAERYRQFLPLLCDPLAEVVIAGRVSNTTWELQAACRKRIFAEERGLASAPREHKPRSVLGFLLEEVGIERFFERMAQLGNGMVLDTRVIEAHLGITPSREDRFQSDLFNWEAIEDPFLSRFTEAAAHASIPVLLGGHSLVSGGLMAINDIAWRENDRREGLA